MVSFRDSALITGACVSDEQKDVPCHALDNCSLGSGPPLYRLVPQCAVVVVSVHRVTHMRIEDSCGFRRRTEGDFSTDCLSGAPYNLNN